MKQTHLTIVQGTPFEFLVKVTQRDEESEEDPKPLVPMPLTGCAIQLQARAKRSSGVAVVNLTNGEGIYPNEEEGEFLIRMTSAETSALNWPIDASTDGRIVFQCEVTPPDGESFRVLEGTLRLDREVVR